MEKHANTENKLSIPKCVGIIMDGNRRWAKEKGLSKLEGHRAGYNKIKEILRWAKKLGITEVVAYAFSTENWNREPQEVGYLMGLLSLALNHELSELKNEGIRIRVIGDRARLPAKLQEAIVAAEHSTSHMKEGSLTLAISYGGRNEIINAIKSFMLCGKAVEELSEDEFRNHLYTKDMPDPDLVIRTSGEMRLSNFLPWQSVYSELFFTKTYWPDLSEDEFATIVKEYGARQRRMGK